MLFSGNTSTDDLEKFLKGSEGFIDPEGEEVTVTMATTDVNNAASLPVHIVRTTHLLNICHTRRRVFMRSFITDLNFYNLNMIFMLQESLCDL